MSVNDGNVVGQDTPIRTRLVAHRKVAVWREASGGEGGREEGRKGGREAGREEGRERGGREGGSEREKESTTPLLGMFYLRHGLIEI